MRSFLSTKKPDISVSKIIGWLKSRKILSKVVVLLELVLVAAATNATSGRSFSALVYDD